MRREGEPHPAESTITFTCTASECGIHERQELFPFRCLKVACQFLSHSSATSEQRISAEPTNILAIPCPVCHAWTFRANIDEGYQILCSSCQWKQKIVAEPAEQRIADAIKELEIGIEDSKQIRDSTIDPEGKAFWRGRIKEAEEAITLLKGGGGK